MDKYSEKADVVAKALDIPEILETIFNHLDIQRLKLSREVCLKWCNEISRMFLRRVVPRYVNPAPGTSMFQELVNTGKGLVRLLCPFQEIYAAISNENVYAHPFDYLDPPFPITRLSLSFITTTDDLALTKNVWLLLQNCSQTLTHLKTHFWSMPEGRLEQDLCLKFVQLKALSVKNRFRVSREPCAKELRFFIFVISSAPKLSHLELHAISCAPELLIQAPLKNIEKLVVDYCLRVFETWTALSSFHSDKLKSLYTTGGQGLTLRRRSRKKFCSQFSSTLEHVGGADGSWELLGLPNVRRLDFDAKQRFDLSTFPSLREVQISSMYRPEHLGISNSQPSRTVRAVYAERLGFPTHSIGRTALVQLLNCFPLATYWRINYHHSLPDFCQAIEQVQFPIQKLRVVLSCSPWCPCNRSRSAMKAAVVDLVAFSSLHLLKDLRELELHQTNISFPLPRYRPGRYLEERKLFPYSVSTIRFSKLPHLRVLRIFSGATSIPQDLKVFEHLDISIELIVNSGNSSPNWSDSILPMKNVTMYTRQTEFP